MQLFSDGECPLCLDVQLALNVQDFLECPSCGLVCSAADTLVAAVMPFVGSEHFRIEDTRVNRFKGTAFARNVEGTCLPDYRQLFNDAAQLKTYVESLRSPLQEISKTRRLLQDFLIAMRESLSDAGEQVLRRAWVSKSDRTRFYADTLMPDVGARLGLIHRKEKFTVDHVLLKRSINDHHIPQVYIESENDYNGATHEIEKLCSHNTPLRVLITVSSKEFLDTPGGGAYGKIREWQGIIRAYNRENYNFQGMLAIVVGRVAGSRIAYDACAFHPNGDLVVPLNTLFEQR